MGSGETFVVHSTVRLIGRNFSPPGVAGAFHWTLYLVATQHGWEGWRIWEAALRRVTKQDKGLKR